MAKHLATEGDDDPCSELLMQILEGRPEYEVAAASSPYNRRGKGKGVLRGGNLAVLNGLASTPYDLMDLKDGEDVVLFTTSTGYSRVPSIRSCFTRSAICASSTVMAFEVLTPL